MAKKCLAVKHNNYLEKVDAMIILHKFSYCCLLCVQMLQPRVNEMIFFFDPRMWNDWQYVWFKCSCCVIWTWELQSYRSMSNAHSIYFWKNSTVERHLCNGMNFVDLSSWIEGFLINDPLCNTAHKHLSYFWLRAE